MVSYQPIIGLEVHIELATASKMFCRCLASYFGHKPNTHVCPVCLGLPGALPVPNRQAIKMTVLTGLALGCKVSSFSKFDRKNYFYPDLPKGYQISQYDLPLCEAGKVVLEKKKIRIRRVHLEEDTAKLIHQAVAGERVTLIDFNRSGVPLMEIVTEPDISSARQARKFLQKLQKIVRYLGVSDCDMEKGSMRLEANVSVKKSKTAQLPGYKVEIKNLNSFRFVEKAIAFEVERQTKLLEQGKKLIQETRGWNEIKQTTYPQRFKEEEQDYRYFPEPDLPPIRWRKKEIEEIKNSLPELPDEKLARFQEQYGLSQYQARILSETRRKADYFEEAAKLGKKHGLKTEGIANVIVNKRIAFEKLLPASLVEILVKAKKAPRLSTKRLRKLVSEVIAENKKAVKDFKAGKRAAIEFLVGQVARKTKGQADPSRARELLLEKLKKR